MFSTEFDREAAVNCVTRVRVFALICAGVMVLLGVSIGGHLGLRLVSGPGWERDGGAGSMQGAAVLIGLLVSIPPAGLFYFLSDSVCHILLWYCGREPK